MRYLPDFPHLLDLAAQWAEREFAAHGKLYSGQPYIVHLKAVDDVLVRFGFGDPENPIHQNLRIAGYSHDHVEDLAIRIETIRALQGPDVADLVGAVTREPGENRDESYAATYPKIRNTPWVTTLKLSDRIANVEASIAGGNRILEMYRKEQPAFREALYEPDSPNEAMWQHLEGLFAGAKPEFKPVACPNTAEPAPWIL